MLFDKNLLMSIPAALGVLCSLAAPAQSDTRQTLAPLPQHEPVTVAVPAEMPASMVAEIVGVSTQWPDGRRSVVEGTSRVYWATLQHKVCSSRISCRTVDETLMKTVVDFRPYSYDGRTKGLVTSYCPDETSDRCPSWVNGVK